MYSERVDRYFNRDVECIRTFFRRRFRYESKLYPHFKSTLGESDGDPEGEGFRLDVVVAASGFKNSDQKALEDVRAGIHDITYSYAHGYFSSTWNP